jgi:hypothetical protein
MAGKPYFSGWLEPVRDGPLARHGPIASDGAGYDFDPMAFSIDSVNKMLLPARRRGQAPEK